MTDLPASRPALPVRDLPVRDLMALASCTLGQAVGCTTLIGFATGAFVYPLSQAFGWSRTQIQTAPTVLIIVTLFTSFGVGWLSDKASPRWMVAPSQIVFGAGFFALAALTTADIKVFYALHAALALAGACALPIALNRIVVTRFVRRRGLAIAVMLTGTGLCGLVLPPYLSVLIERFGWRGAYIGLGLAPILVGLLSLVLLPKERPGRSTTATAAPPVELTGVTLTEAFRDWRLWALGAALLLGSGVATAAVVATIPFLRDQGVGPVAASTALSAYGLAVIVGRLAVGALIDRFWAPGIAALAMLPAAAAMAFMGAHGVGLGGAIVCSVAIGAASGAEADMLSYLPAKYFGLRHMARIYAFLYICLITGIASAGPVVGALYDHIGSYRLVLIGSGAIWFVAALLLLCLGRYRFRV